MSRVFEICARAAHNVNNAYCEAIGDPKSPTWEEMTDEQRHGVIQGAKHALAGGSARESHELWMQSRLAEGWIYGPVKDFAKKISPNLVAYDDLPVTQRAKDAIFQAVVREVASAMNECAERDPTVLQAFEKQGRG